MIHQERLGAIGPEEADTLAGSTQDCAMPATVG
jgi:hypothetical protein